jgi:hypothetical protein
MFQKKQRLAIMLLFSLLFVMLCSLSVSGSTQVLDVRVIEYITEVVAYDQTLGASDAQSDSYVVTESLGELGENDTGTSRTGVSLHKFQINGTVNISNVESSGYSTVTSINVTIDDTENIDGITLLSGPSYLVYNISSGENPSSVNNISIFIAELRYGDSVVFNFTVTGNGIGEPLNFTETYDSWRMMTGNATNVKLNVTNSFPTDLLIYDLELTKTPGCYDAIGGTQSCFRFTDLSGTDSSNATIDSSGSTTILYWNASNRTLAQDEVASIQFKAWAPVNLTIPWNDSADWATWMNMGNLSASFKFNGSMSNMTLSDVTGIVPDARVGVSKDRINESHWNATFNITNDANASIDYNVTYISVWATKYQEYSDPGDTSTWIDDSNVIGTGFSLLTGTTANASWYPNLNLSQTETNSEYSIVFNYTLIPIVWATADFQILDDGYQIFELNQTRTLDGGYLFIEEIYVLLGGYLVKVTKVINPYDLSPTINNSYLVNVTLENIGNEKTPEWVSMFDLIPDGFWPLDGTNALSTTRNMTDENEIRVTNFAGNWANLATSINTVLGYADTGAISSGTYANYWGYHIDFNGLNASSNGNGRFDGDQSTKEIGVSYKIAGNTTISRIENAYLVGVDPIRLEGANPSRSIISRLTASSNTAEYAVLFVSLIVSMFILLMGLGIFKKK